MSKIARIKGLLLSAAEAQHEGNRDIASNLMEILLDEAREVSTEDLDVGLEVVNDNSEDVVRTFFEEDNTDDDHDEVASHSKLYEIVGKMTANAR